MRRFARERGAASALILFLFPVLTIGLVGMIDVGTIMLAKASMQSAADMAALAAVQEVDLEALAEGRIVIISDQAIQTAQTWAQSNMLRLDGVLEPDTLTVDVAVHNASPDTPVVHWSSGRTLTDPTVSIKVQARVRLPAGLLGRAVSVAALADASVVLPQEQEGDIAGVSASALDPQTWASWLSGAFALGHDN